MSDLEWLERIAAEQRVAMATWGYTPEDVAAAAADDPGEQGEIEARYRQAEATEFPPVPEDKVFCDLRGIVVGVGECATNCAAPEHRPVCWLGKTWRDEPLEGGAG